jgi:HK97 family phage prohead protease
METDVIEKPTNDIIQRRFMATETKIDAGKLKIAGYSVLFDVETRFGNWLIETVAPGACKKTIKEGDIRCLFNHDPSRILGRSEKGAMKTLRLKEDSKGLEYEADLPNTSYANDLRESIDRGDVTGCSFQFRTIKDKWSYSQNRAEPDRVQILEMQLYDVGPVTFPQYPETSVGLRSVGAIDFDRFQFLLLKQSRVNNLDNSEVEFVRNIFSRFSLTSTDAESGDHSKDELEPELVSTLFRMRQKGISITTFLEDL